MGLRNASATFQRAMNFVLTKLIGRICFVYLDDVIIFGHTLEEHNNNLKTFLKRLQQFGIKVQPDVNICDLN